MATAERLYRFQTLRLGEPLWEDRAHVARYMRSSRAQPRAYDAGVGDDVTDREAILARRQRFISLALIGMTGAAGCSRREPEPSASPDSTATRCSSPEGGAEGGGSDSDSDVSATDGDDASSGQRTCVDPIDMPPPRPPKELELRLDWRGTPRQVGGQPCLRVALPPLDE